MARIIEAKAVISAEDRTGAVLDKIGRKFRDLGKRAKVSAEIDRLNKSLSGTQKQLSAIDRINAAQAKLASSRLSLAGAQQRVEQVSAALAAARKANDTKAVTGLAAQHKQAQLVVQRTNASIERQAEALKGARRSFAEFGVPVTNLVAHQNALRSSVEQTTAALRKQIVEQARQNEAMKRRADRREAYKTLGAGVAAMAPHKAIGVAKGSIESAARFDIAVRKQKVFADLTDDDQGPLLAQAKRVGQETQFSNEDVVKSQTAAMQGLPAGFSSRLKAEVAEGIIGNVRNFSTLMETDLQEGTEIIRGYLQASGKDISTKAKALAEANKATNQLVKMAKLGGMDGEDVKNFSNYAIASASSSGLSTDATMALGALARRGGLKGDVAGVAVRSMAGKIVAPTSKGLAALNAAGVKYSDFVRMPDRLSTDALEGQFQNSMGKGFTPEIRKKLEEINTDKTLIADRGKYVEAVTSAVSPMLGRTKKGTVRAADAKVAAKAAGTFHNLSGSSVDAEGLLDAAFSKGMTLPQLNAWLTDKHGGKGSITQRQWDEFHASRKAIGDASNDPDWAKKKADYVMAGLGGSIENFHGSIENAMLTIGNVNSPLIKGAADGMGSGLDTFSNLPGAAQQSLSLGAGAAAMGAGWWGTMRLIRTALGLGGTAAGAAGAGAGGAGGKAAANASARMIQGMGGAVAGAGAGGLIGPAILGTGIVGGALLDSGVSNSAGDLEASAKAWKDAMRKAHGPDSVRDNDSVIDVFGGWVRSLLPTALGGNPSAPIPVEVKSLPANGGEPKHPVIPGSDADRSTTRSEALPPQRPNELGGAPALQGPITATVADPVPVTVGGTLEGTLSGQAQVNVTVTVAPSPLLLSTVESAKTASMQAQAATRATVSNGPGSTGKSSPDAGKGSRE